MSKIISILNHKGGVGKTTTAINLGAALALRGYKILLLDIDPQANVTSSLGFISKMEKKENTIAAALESPKKIKLPIYNYKENLDVVCSCIELAGTELGLLNVPGREYILSSLLKPLENKYDYILIDCPPSLNMLPQNALTASHSVIIPVEAEFLAMQGMKNLLDIIELVKDRLNAQLSVLGFLVTKFDKRKVLNQSIAESLIQQQGDKVFKTFIRSNVTLGESTSQGKDIYSYDSTCYGAKDYAKLAGEVIQRI